MAKRVLALWMAAVLFWLAGAAPASAGGAVMRREVDGPYLILHYQGSLTYGHMTSLRSMLQRELASGRNRIIVNLAGVQRVDERALSELDEARREANKLGGGLVLLHPRDYVRQEVVKAVRQSKACSLPMYETMQGARKYFDG